MSLPEVVRALGLALTPAPRCFLQQNGREASYKDVSNLMMVLIYDTNYISFVSGHLLPSTSGPYREYKYKTETKVKDVPTTVYKDVYKYKTETKYKDVPTTVYKDVYKYKTETKYKDVPTTVYKDVYKYKT